MAINEFENSRASEGTLRTGAQHNGSERNESKAISRDDVRDGAADTSPQYDRSPAKALTKARRVLAVSKLMRAALERAPGFDKTDWPNLADPAFVQQARIGH